MSIGLQLAQLCSGALPTTRRKLIARFVPVEVSLLLELRRRDRQKQGEARWTLVEVRLPPGPRLD